MKYTYIVFIVFVLFNVRCKKEKTYPSNTYWHQIAGKWQIADYYYINNNLKVIPEVENKLVVSISPPDFENASQYEQCTFEKEIYHPKGYFYNTISGYGWTYSEGDKFISSTGDIVNYNFFGLRSINSLGVFRSFQEIERIGSYDDYYIPPQQNIPLSDFCPLEKIDNNSLKHLSLSHGTSLDYDFFLISKDILHIREVKDVLGRSLNNLKLLDTVDVFFTRLETNVSDILTVQDFTPNQFDIYERLDFNSSSSSGSLKNGAERVDGGKEEKCLSLNGHPQYVLLDDNNWFQEVNNESGFSISFWIKPTSLTKPHQVIWSKYHDETYGVFEISLNQNKIEFKVNNGFGTFKSLLGNKAIVANEWNHITYLIKDEKFSLYIDGEFDIEDELYPFNYDASSKNLIGVSQYAIDNQIEEHYFEGYIDDVIVVEEKLNTFFVRLLFDWYN